MLWREDSGQPGGAGASADAAGGGGRTVGEQAGGCCGCSNPKAGCRLDYALLRKHAGRVDVWMTAYHHVLMGGTDAVVEWFRGSGLRPFLEPLDPAETVGFLAEYRAALADAYPPLADGSVLLPFPRLFIVATR